MGGVLGQRSCRLVSLLFLVSSCCSGLNFEEGRGLDVYFMMFDTVNESGDGIELSSYPTF